MTIAYTMMSLFDGLLANWAAAECGRPGACDEMVLKLNAHVGHFARLVFSTKLFHLIGRQARVFADAAAVATLLGGLLADSTPTGLDGPVSDDSAIAISGLVLSLER